MHRANQIAAQPPPVMLQAVVDIRHVASPAVTPTPPLFRRLLGETAWRRLAPGIRDRFAAEPAIGRPVWYTGSMAIVRCSRLGAVLAHLCRLIGTPLAPYAGDDVPVRVRVEADVAEGGVVWLREYDFPGRRRVTVRSVKKHDERDGLCECVGGGIGMQLAIFERHGAIHFESRRYFWQLGPWRVPVPGFLTPGVTHVTHSEAGGGWFRFTLDVRHPLLGETFYQDGYFHETEED